MIETARQESAIVTRTVPDYGDLSVDIGSKSWLVNEGKENTAAPGQRISSKCRCKTLLPALLAVYQRPPPPPPNPRGGGRGSALLTDAEPGE